MDKTTRSKMMSGIGSRNTQPELLIRTRLHALGFRYRLNYAALPGKPDMVFPKYKAVIQINGCFWHLHHCHLFKWPKSRRQFWQRKLSGNAARDARNIAELESMGWRVLTVWECALKGRKKRKLPEIIHTAANWIQFGESSASIEGHTLA